MSRFSWHPIRERDENGDLLAAGLQWAEERDVALAGYWLAGAVLLFVGTAALLLWLAGKGGLLLVLACFGVVAWLIVSARRLPGRTRALVFHQDGSTSAPYGFNHYHHSHRHITGHNSNFVSIEARGQGSTMCDVVLFTRCGETVYVAGWLHRDSAHKVAVQLTLALAELRECLGRDPAAGAYAPHPRDAPVALID